MTWDTFEARMIEPVKKLLKEMKINDALIPGGCTEYIQAPDVFRNKPFKGRMMEFYDELYQIRKYEACLTPFDC